MSVCVICHRAATYSCHADDSCGYTCDRHKNECCTKSILTCIPTPFWDETWLSEAIRLGQALSTEHSNDPWILRDIVNAKVAGVFTNRAQSATCLFCRKTLVTWKKGTSRDARQRTLPVKHLKTCARQWIADTMCAYSCESMNIDRRIIVARYISKRTREWDAGPYYQRKPMGWDKFIESLPQPAYSTMALYLEISLVAISDYYVYGKVHPTQRADGVGYLEGNA